ncbi:hypothetical protein AB4Z09_14595 [Rhodococcus sp. TAF43]|uniref:hypothetical protein n=1 Tax=unclassified Rhodococcus (in: high G+C Gram-positive bacteria) TaxID=192944 RepID=UPI001581422D|nr:hypothetical protein [Rhodococcus sp. W8901]QKT09350.1 hypothetical protein HUN07_00130 [Rhodococcus sp. W8901]
MTRATKSDSTPTSSAGRRRVLIGLGAVVAAVGAAVVALTRRPEMPPVAAEPPSVTDPR